MGKAKENQSRKTGSNDSSLPKPDSLSQVLSSDKYSAKEIIEKWYKEVGIYSCLYINLSNKFNDLLNKMDKFDFTDCKTVEDVNKKWLEYNKEVEPYKTFIRKLKEKLEGER